MFNGTLFFITLEVDDDIESISPMTLMSFLSHFFNCISFVLGRPLPQATGSSYIEPFWEVNCAESKRDVRQKYLPPLQFSV